MTLNEPAIVIRNSKSFGRRIAQVVSGGRSEDWLMTSAVIKASPGGRTVQTHSGSVYTLAGVVLLQRYPGARGELVAEVGAPVRWSDFVDGVEPLEVSDVDQP